ncbi:hypothetical protein BDA99DRAFT_556159 [Phascolomyces articulosus]|uniref:Uncharacterized protein n=1 Tax=Phascolomyces articulosus TaxID=60185 RepID=A0AAD5PI97_9FUNG|nr:hypothetical protein BDA99DRAFT_556159 [Phascolomyces articulosus]
MPQFRCTRCDQHLNHLQVKNIVNDLVSKDMNQIPEQPQPPQHLQVQSMEISSNQPDLLQQILQQLEIHQQRLNEHDNIHAELAKLKSELEQANERSIELESINKQLSTQLHQQSTPTMEKNVAHKNHIGAPATDSENLSLSTSKHAPQNPWKNPTRTHQLRTATQKRYLLNRKERQEQAAIRMFQPPSTTQGFQYMYFTVKNRMPIGQVRRHFRAIGINNGRVLDLYYPEKNTLAALIHNDFSEELSAHLGNYKITHKKEFDPCDPIHLHDPKYKDKITEERTNQAFRLHVERMERAVRNIRPQVAFAVARAFQEHGWISEETVSEIFPHKQKRQSSINSVFGERDEEDDIESMQTDDDIEI